MNYQLEMPKTVRGITFQVVCRIVNPSVVGKRSLFVSGQKTPIVILVHGDGDPKVLDLGDNAHDEKIIEDIQCQIPAVRDLLS